MEKFRNIPIIYTEWNLANNFGSYIELNKNLKKYPDLHNPILRHELGHSNKSFSMYDLKHDLRDNKVSSFKIIKFMVKHPKSFTQLLPFYWTKSKGFVYDLNMILIDLFLLSIIGGSIFLSLKFL